MKGNVYDVGVQFEISSADNVPEAAARSYQQRLPLRDQEVTGGRTFGRVRPFWVLKAVARIEVLETKLKEWGAWHEGKLREASVVSKGYFARFSFLLIVGADGSLLGPVVSNAIETAESDLYRFLVGLAVSIIIAGGSWAIACIFSPLPPRFGRPTAILVSGVAGGVTGYYIGAAGDGTEAGKILRTILTSSSMMAVVALHYAIEASRVAWGPVRTALKLIHQMEKEMKKLMNKVAPYQDEAIDSLQEHNLNEVARHEGLITGRHAYDKQGVRVSYVPQRFKAWFENLLGAVAVLATLAAVPGWAWADNKIVVCDTTSSIDNVDALIEKLVGAIPITYGDVVTGYTLNGSGLNFAYAGSVKRVSQPAHRQSLAKVKEELVAGLKRAANTGDNNDSPIVSALLSLAVDLRLQASEGKQLTVVVASDFKATDAAKIKGQPFADMHVIAVLPSSAGRSPHKRQAEIELAQKLFAGARSLHFVQ